jgi:DNA-binding CsgD family transcriptional regulator
VPTVRRRRSVRLPKWNRADITELADKPNPDDLPMPQATGTGYDENLALERLKQRSTPAMFIVGADNTVLYANEEALNIFKNPSGIPAEIQGFCHRIQTRAADAPFDSSGMDCAVFKGPGNNLYSFRGFLMKGPENAPRHVMVLVEKAAERSPVDLKKARKKFRLSEREIEVVNLLAQGLCNKEIGAKLYVSEYTVKGHLKNITRKVGAESRGNIIAILK